MPSTTRVIIESALTLIIGLALLGAPLGGGSCAGGGVERMKSTYALAAVGIIDS